MQCWHISIRMAMCTSSCPFSLLSCIPTCHSTPGHGHMPSAWPVDQRCSGLAWQLTMHALTHSSSNRWVKRWTTSCVKWTEGRGVLAIMVKQTAKRDKVCVYVCLYNKKRCTWAYTSRASTKTTLHSKQENHLDNQLTEDGLRKVPASVYRSLPYSLRNTQGICEVNASLDMLLVIT